MKGFEIVLKKYCGSSHNMTSKMWAKFIKFNEKTLVLKKGRSTLSLKFSSQLKFESFRVNLWTSFKCRSKSSLFLVNSSLHFNRQIWFSCVLTSPASSYYSALLNTRYNPAQNLGKDLGYNQAINNKKHIYYSNQPWFAVCFFRFCCNYF